MNYKVWTLLGGVLLTGCVATEREMRIDYDLTQLKKRLSVIEQGTAAQSEAARQIEALGKRQADTQAAQEALRVELRTVRGQLDESARRQREQQDSQGLAQEELLARFNRLDARLTALEKSLDEMKNAPPVVAAAPVSGATTPALLYSQGRDGIQKGEPAAGRQKLEEFIRLQPQSDMIPNAYYWIGESYYAEKNYESAILQFQDVIEKFPAHAKAAAALFKQALAFKAMGEEKKGNALLLKLTEIYPKAEEAPRAKAMLAEKKTP